MEETKSPSTLCLRLCLGFGGRSRGRVWCQGGQKRRGVNQAHSVTCPHRHLLKHALPAWSLVFGLHKSSQKKFSFNPLAPSGLGVLSLNPGLFVCTQESFSWFCGMCWGVGNYLPLSNPSHSHLFSRIWWLTQGVRRAGNLQEDREHLSVLWHTNVSGFCCCPKPRSTLIAFYRFHPTLIKEKLFLVFF